MNEKVVLITGATSGIGRYLSLYLAESGAKLALCGRSKEKMDSLVKELCIPETKLCVDTFDVSSEADIIAFVNKTATKFGTIDVLINNAGANTAKAKVDEIKTSDFDYMYAVNLRAPFIFMREVFKFMKEKQNGKIVNILSTTCLFSNETIGSYSAMKSGFESLTKIFQKEARHENVNVFAVYPGGTDTGFRANERPDYMKASSVAKVIIANMLVPSDVMMHELVFRPMVENNF